MNPHPSLGLQGINLLANKFPEYEIYIMVLIVLTLIKFIIWIK